MKLPVAPLVFMALGAVGVVMQDRLDPNGRFLLIFYLCAGLFLGGVITLVAFYASRGRAGRPSGRRSA